MDINLLIGKIIQSKIKLNEILREVKPIKTVFEIQEDINKHNDENLVEHYRLKDEFREHENEANEYEPKRNYNNDEILPNEEEENKRMEELILNKIEKRYKYLLNQILVLVEKDGLVEYRKYIKTKLKKYTKNRKELLKTISFDFYNINQESEQYQIISDIDEILTPFDFSTTDELEELKKARGIEYLENILKNTSTIIRNIGQKPTSETQVYNAVKFVINSTFPSSQNPRKAFLSSAKSYEPDILIPFLEVAVEYKYATTVSFLTTAIDQISADVQGYNLDRGYKYFYAVFFVKDDAKNLGEIKFRSHVKNLDFPKNWKFYYIEE